MYHRVSYYNDKKIANYTFLDIGDCVQSGTYYINRTGMSITLTAAVNITNGPINHTIWTDQDDLPVNITHDSRFQTPETGMLTIDDVSSADIGVWVFGIVNNSETLICNVTLALPGWHVLYLLLVTTSFIV